MSAPTRELSRFARSFLEQYEASASAKPWLRELREGARERFEEFDLPDAKLEDWRFTPLKDLPAQSFDAPPRSAEPVEGTLQFAAGEAIVLEFVDGVLHDAETLQLPRGLELSELDADGPEAGFGNLASPSDDGITALNTAGFPGAYVLRVREGAEVPGVLHLRFESVSANFVFPRLLLIGEPHSTLTVVEEHVGAGEYLSAAVVEIRLLESARWEHMRIQRESSESRHLHRMAARLDAGARLRSDSLVLGGGLVRNQLDVDLCGSGASCHLGGIVVAGRDELVDHHTRIRHLVPDTKSVERFRHVLDDRARGVFCGMVHVAEDAQRTDAEQSNRNLLLSDDALMNTMPQLEIYADDVKCTHGATLGQLDDDALFYLRARGIDAEGARSMLVHAFVDELVDELPLAAVRDHVRVALARRLPGEAPLLEIG